MSDNNAQFPLNKPVIEHRFFVRGKLVTLTGDGSNVKETRYTPARPLTATTITGALEEAYSLYNPDNADQRWVAFEVYEEEVITTRRLLHTMQRTPRQLDEMVNAYRESLIVDTVEKTETVDGKPSSDPIARKLKYNSSKFGKFFAKKK